MNSTRSAVMARVSAGCPTASGSDASAWQEQGPPPVRRTALALQRRQPGGLAGLDRISNEEGGSAMQPPKGGFSHRSRCASARATGEVA